jgi:hypothetical protein
MAACEDPEGRMILNRDQRSKVPLLIPVMKFSDHPEKTTNPGVKQIWRF